MANTFEEAMKEYSDLFDDCISKIKKRDDIIKKQSELIRLQEQKIELLEKQNTLLKREKELGLI